MNWAQQTPFSWKREDGKGYISAARQSGVIWYAAWARDESSREHPAGWRCVAIVTTPGEAREAIAKLN